MKRVIVFLLSIIGISVVSCAKYAAPVASFELKGKVTDTLDNPIENIQIHVQQNEYTMDVIYSDVSGNFYLTDYLGGNMIMIKVDDIDGEENGGDFVTQIITFPVKDSDYIYEGKKKAKDDGGKVSKEINFKLISK
jgi:putative lipoprotein (rSAM/lipoprotein system)